MNEKWATALAGVTLAALTLTGCSSDSGEDDSKKLDAWAKEVCVSMKSLLAQVDKAEQDTGVVKPEEEPADLKKRLSDDMELAASSYRQLAVNVQRAGPPPVDDGKKLFQDAVHELNNSAQAYDDLKQQVDELDTKNRDNFVEGLTDVSKEQQVLGRMDNAALRRLGTGETGQAMAKQAGCKAGKSTDTGSPPASGSDADAGS